MTTSTIVLISGANQGIGFEISKKLATEQSNWLILLGSRDPVRGKYAAIQLSGLASVVEPVQLDLSSDQSITQCAAMINQKYGRLDILINNAGISNNAIKNQLAPRRRFEIIFDTNVYGTTVLTDVCVPLLKRSTSPRVIFITSEMGSIGNTLDPNFPYYDLAIMIEYKSSKAALNMIGAIYATQYGKDGFKVNMCCPGLRPTNMTSPDGEFGGPVSEGAINACRLAVQGDDGPNGSFSNIQGAMPW